MPLPLPKSLTPSKVASFKDCALAFRFSVIDRLPEPPSVPALKGTVVHKILERLFWECEPGYRSEDAANIRLIEETQKFFQSNDWLSLEMDDKAEKEFFTDAKKLVGNYFKLEDPNSVKTIGTELMLETTVGTMTLRGIIDRLDMDEDGNLIVVDYKTGRAPGANFENGKLGGVQFYAFLCEQVLGRRPVSVKLLHLKEPLSIKTDPTEQSIRGMKVRTSAIWTAVEKACNAEDFRPSPGRLCSWCAFQQYCPAKGGSIPDLSIESSTQQPLLIEQHA